MTTTHEPALGTAPRVVIGPESPESTPGRIRGGSRRRAPSSRPRPNECGGSAAPSLHGARLTRRGRIVMACAWLLLLGVGALGLVRPWAQPDPVEVTTTVQVGAGETLWEVAGDVAPGADRRETIAVIIELNELDSPAAVNAGDVLTVPAR